MSQLIYWSADTVQVWLKSILKFDKNLNFVLENLAGLSGTALARISDEQLTSLGISLVSRLNIIAHRDRILQTQQKEEGLWLISFIIVGFDLVLVGFILVEGGRKKAGQKGKKSVHGDVINFICISQLFQKKTVCFHIVRVVNSWCSWAFRSSLDKGWIFTSSNGTLC
jgi:hypothetical protein